MNDPWNSDEAIVKDIRQSLGLKILRTAITSFMAGLCAGIVLTLLCGCSERPEVETSGTRYLADDGMAWVSAELAAAGIEDAWVPWPPDRTYVVPTVEAAHKALAAFQWSLAVDNITYETDGYDCDDYAQDFASYFRRLHRRANPGSHAAIAIAYVPVVNTTEWAGVGLGGHALNIAILQGSNGPGLYVIEPQRDARMADAIEPLAVWPNRFNILWEAVRP